VLQLIHSD